MGQFNARVVRGMQIADRGGETAKSPRAKLVYLLLTEENVLE
jgi:hypothetical protein